MAPRTALDSLLTLGVALLCLGTVTQDAVAAEMYIAPTGVNSGPCTSEEAPCSSVSCVQSQATGRTRGKRCVTGPKAPKRGATCKRLGAGSYRVALTATDAAGNRSPVARSGFTAARR